MRAFGFALMCCSSCSPQEDCQAAPPLPHEHRNKLLPDLQLELSGSTLHRKSVLKSLFKATVPDSGEAALSCLPGQLPLLQLPLPALDRSVLSALPAQLQGTLPPDLCQAATNTVHGTATWTLASCFQSQHHLKYLAGACLKHSSEQRLWNQSPRGKLLTEHLCQCGSCAHFPACSPPDML